MKNFLTQNIEKFLFYLFLFCIPFQTRVFLLSADATPGFNEWQSLFLYGTDLLVFAMFLLWAVSSRHAYSGPAGTLKKKISRFKVSISKKLQTPSFQRKRQLKIALFVFVFFSFASIFFSSYQVVAFYRFIKLLEFIFVFFYVSRALKITSVGSVFLAFSFGAVVQSFIAIGQFAAQRSLGLKLLGEPFLRAGRTDVAEFVAFGGRYMRSYGTFSSPNVLAAYLVLALLFLITWYIFCQEIKGGIQ